MAGRSRRSRKTAVEFVTDPVESAVAADLRYVNADEPGIGRRRSGKGFSYIGPDGKTIRDRAVRRRIEALAIPPAWTDVWICADDNGHIQATGRDARGRKQYRYHERWHQVRGQTKFDRMLLFARALPLIRQRAAEDMRRPGLPREKVLGAVVTLLGQTLIRVGNDEYARQNESFGLTTMQDEHVEVNGAELRFEFRGKSGKQQRVSLRDRRLARIVRKSQEVPGQALFQYYGEDGGKHRITSSDVNAYLKDITGESFTAKDFRTWGGTVRAIEALCAMPPYEDDATCKKHIVEMFKLVAKHLGNTVAVCRRYYVHPAVVSAYQQGALPPAGAREFDTSCEGLDPREALVVMLLRRDVPVPA